MSVEKGISTLAIGSPFASLFSLPQEILRLILSSIASFEPWTYNSAPEHTENRTPEQEGFVYRSDTTSRSLPPMSRHSLGISSESNWFTTIISRHSHHLSRRGEVGISSVVSQALRRMNARTGKMYWEGRNSETTLQIPIIVEAEPSEPKETRPEYLQDDTVCEDGISSTPTPKSMKQYHATVELEEEALLCENLTRLSPTIINADCTCVASNALIAYSSTPVLKLSEPDLLHIVRQQVSREATEELVAILITIIIMFAQCRLNLLKNIENLKRDIPIPSVESCEIRESIPPKIISRQDRMRSLSGSTVAEAFPFEEALSFSPVSTVYSAGNRISEVRRAVTWAEKRATEEHGTDISPKRMKLTDYERVSNGRVAILMDKFEKFHL
ncbi:hypothetical protein OPT61_g4342 [Boeremia exigua]|uniref:Uncharacterized protein n=1 Tax=Boeremia exigua TaxID=749465 RepID=A0ACC2IEC7_9PLEO|nr:hypothetical protein OPT61_g4342 [Boeremia exigua]